MIEILDRDEGISFGGKANIKLSFILAKHLANVDKAVNYYKLNYKFVPSSHILVRLLGGFTWDLTQGAVNSFNMATDNLQQICTALGITTSQNKGDLDEDSFYGRIGTILLSDSRATFSDIIGNWKGMVPLEIVYRDGINGALQLPDEDQVVAKGSYTAIQIDIPLLAAMYTKWYIENKKKPVGERESTTMFVGKYILPELIRSQNRVIYMNMFKDWNNKLLSKYIGNKVPFQTVDQLPDLYKEIGKICTDLRKVRSKHSRMLEEIPGFDKEGLINLVPDLGGILLTEANFWAYLAISIPFVSSILFVTSSGPEMDTVRSRFQILKRKITGQRPLNKTPSEALGKRLRLDYLEIVSVIEK